MCRHKSFWRGTKWSQIFGPAQKIWTGTKHFATCKRTRHKILQWRTFQKFDQLCEKVSESGNQERCCQTDRQTSTRRSIIWGEPLHFAGLRESMKFYFWNRFYSKSKWKDTSCIIYYLHYYLLNVSYHNVTNLVPKEGGVMRAFSGYGQARRDI